jgi:hypothetical protein
MQEDLMYEARKAAKEFVSKCCAVLKHNEREAVPGRLVEVRVNISRLLPGRSVVQENIVRLHLVPIAEERASIYLKVALGPAEVQVGCSSVQVRRAG